MDDKNGLNILVIEGFPIICIFPLDAKFRAGLLLPISMYICQSNEPSIWNIVGKVAGVDHPCSSSADNTRSQTFSGQAFLSPDLAEYIICSNFILDLFYLSSKLIKKIKKCEVMLNYIRS